MYDAFPSKDMEPEVRHYIVRMVGTGASAPTKELGNGITITRAGVGRYLLTWKENPGKFLRALPGLQAATPGDLAGHTVIADTYDATAFALEVDLFNASFAAHDLAALEYIHLDVAFALSSVSATGS